MTYVFVLDDSHYPPMHTMRANWYDCSVLRERNIKENVVPYLRQGNTEQGYFLNKMMGIKL